MSKVGIMGLSFGGFGNLVLEVQGWNYGYLLLMGFRVYGLRFRVWGSRVGVLGPQDIS